VRKGRHGKGEGREGDRKDGRMEEEGGRETKGFISCILLFLPWQLCITQQYLALRITAHGRKPEIVIRLFIVSIMAISGQ